MGEVSGTCSPLFSFAYEIIAGVGIATAAEGVRHLSALLTHYGDHADYVDCYMRGDLSDLCDCVDKDTFCGHVERWRRDFIVYHELSMDEAPDAFERVRAADEMRRRLIHPYEYDDDENILDKVTSEDLRKFGFIPEFIGRLPVICTLQPLSKEMLVKILTEPKNAIIKQYQKLLSLDEVKLNFETEALDYIAEEAQKRKLGARALRSIIEEFMNDIMYEIPKDPNIGEVTITKDYIEGKGSPKITMRSSDVVPKLAVNE